jgi:hypothetical protein
MMDIELLNKIGGKEWIKNGKHRIYFNNLEDLIGLHCIYYNSGNIRTASLRNEGKISNSRATTISAVYGNSKVWFDVNDGQFHSKIQAFPGSHGEDFHDMIVEEIRQRVSQALNPPKTQGDDTSHE